MSDEAVASICQAMIVGFIILSVSNCSTTTRVRLETDCVKPSVESMRDSDATTGEQR